MVVTVFAPHVDDQRQRVSNAHRSTHPVSSGTVSVSNFHVTFGRRQREHDWVSGGHSVRTRRQNGYFSENERTKTDDKRPRLFSKHLLDV